LPYPIQRAEWLGPKLKLLEVAAPEVAAAAAPGQFIMLRLHEKGERIPLTIADFDPGRGTVTIIFLVVGKTTEQLSLLERGDAILDFVGPLGKHLEIGKVGTVVVVGGGVGVPAVYPKAKALKAAGNYLISIIGARSAELLVLEEQMRAISDELYLTTDDGSRGRQGFVSDELADLLAQGRQIDLVIAVGPIPMMAAVAKVTEASATKTLVSLNPIMVDGTGMCGGCRVRVAGQSKYACVDGPIFDAHQVDFRELMSRQGRFLPEERTSLEHFHAHRCGGGSCHAATA